MISSNEQLRAKARAQMDHSVFSNAWVMLVVVFFAYALLSGFSSSLFGVGVILVIPPLAFGLTRILLKYCRGTGKLTFNKELLDDAISGYTECFAGSIGTVLLSALFTFLWSLLLFIPGVIKSYSYSMALFILHDNPELSPMEAISRSQSMMNGYKMKLFLLDLSFLGWYILGELCCAVGLLWVVPYHNLARANFYEELKALPAEF